MPACSSSPIDLLAARVGATSDRVSDADASREADAQAPTDLVAALATVPDPRARRGIRHRLVTVLALAVCAVLAGARSYVAIAEWAHDLPLGVRVRLGLTVGRATPSESAIRRILQKVDPEALDRVVSDWLIARAARTSPPTPDPRAAQRVAAQRAGAERGVRPGADRSAPAEGSLAQDPVAEGDRGGWQVRPRRPPRRRAGGAPARGARHEQRDRAGPVGGRREDERDHRVRPVAGPGQHR